MVDASSFEISCQKVRAAPRSRHALARLDQVEEKELVRTVKMPSFLHGDGPTFGLAAAR
jgi:hypothetical protein